MQSILGLGVVVLVLACTAVGVRLLALFWRTRKLPELALGLAFLFLGVVGYPLSIVARRVAPGPEGGPLLFWSHVAQNIACAAFAVAIWLIFRPGSRWAAVGVAAATGLLTVSMTAESIVLGHFQYSDGGAWYYLGLVVRTLIFLWGASEAIRYYGKLRRRLSLGLADPVLVDRMRLWSVTTVADSGAFLVFFAARLLDVDVAQSTVVVGLTSLCGLVAGVSMWLVFFPPKSYLRRVAQRSSVEEN